MRKAPMWMLQVAGVLSVAAIAAGCTGRTSSANKQLDPGVRAATMVMALERTNRPVTKEQASKLLPLFRALRGTSAEDHPAIDALVRQVDGILTDDQRDMLRRLRERRGPGGAPPSFGLGAPRGGGPGGPGQPGGGQAPGQRLPAFRGQILDRAVALLEARVQ